MKNSFIVDYAACILLRTVGPVIRRLHPVVAFWLGRRIGEIVYVFDVKHRTRAYANLKVAFGDKRTPAQIGSLALDYYRNLGQNIVEIFMIPVINEAYVKKYVSFEGLENVGAAFSRGKGVFFVGMHEGSWELSNMLAAHLRIPYSMFVREQNMPRLNALLNDYRRQKGCRIIRKEDQTRELIRLVKANQSCGMSADQGGRTGILVRFFNRDASMAAGAVRLALKYDAALVPVFSARIRGPYIKVFIEPAVALARTGNDEEDIKTNLQDLVWLFQKYLYRYPKEYLWHYRIWKYSVHRNIVILSDEKTGHLRQSQALARIVVRYLKDKGIDAAVREIPVRIGNPLLRGALGITGRFTCRWFCQGCMSCLKYALAHDSYAAVASASCDIVISCGSSLAAVNRILALENQAKSIVIMKPGGMDCGLFDLCVIASHDNPPQRRNVVVTRGALNLIDEHYLSEAGNELRAHIGGLDRSKPVLGVLWGGDAKRFSLSTESVAAVSQQLRAAADSLNGSLLMTTSRRTSASAQECIRQAFERDARCKFLVIANERNYAFAVGGILDTADVVVISPESISMVSESASSGKYVVVFDAPGLSAKHRSVLNDFQSAGLIRLVPAGELCSTIADLCHHKPASRRLDDTAAVIEGLRTRI